MTPEFHGQLENAVNNAQRAALRYQSALAKHNAVLELGELEKEAEYRMQLHEALDMVLDCNAECARLLKLAQK